jgi:geranylgeranyl pyrophosphate synthase
VHTYSLVHDDLPAMDDDELRHGRPTVHVAYDEATAILVGDALLTRAFEWLAEDEHGRALAGVLARAAGSSGMVGGQALDLSLELAEEDGEGALGRLEDMHRRKTAALFAAACEMGAIVAGRPEARARCAAYGEPLGLLFQAVDDLLDVTGDAATLGKTTGKDAAQARPSLVRALGVAGTRAHAEFLSNAAREKARAVPSGPGKPLHDLVDLVLARSS